MRFLRVAEYPAWFKPKSRKSRSDNEYRFARERKSVDAILAPIGLTRKSPSEQIDNPFLRWYLCEQIFGESDARRKLGEEAFEAGFEGALGMLVSMTRSKRQTQVKYARLAASAGLDEYVLGEALSIYQMLNREHLSDKRELDWGKRINALCGVVARAENPDAFVLMGSYDEAIAMGSVMGMLMKGLETAEKALGSLRASRLSVYRNDPAQIASVRRLAESEADDARKLLGGAAAQGQPDALLKLGKLEEEFENRSEARRWYQMAERAALCSEQRDEAVKGKKRTSGNPITRMGQRI